MMRRWAGTVQLIILLIIVVLGVRALNPGLFPGSSTITSCNGSNFSPAAQIIFNPCATTFSFGSYVDNSPLSTSSCSGAQGGVSSLTGCAKWTTDTTINAYDGFGGQAKQFRYCNVFNVCSATQTVQAFLPSDLPGPCDIYVDNGVCQTTGSYGTSFSLTGPALAGSSNSQCTNTSGGSQDCFTYPAGNSTSPPSICPNGGCYAISYPYTVYKTNSSGTFKATNTRTFYVYRFVFSIVIIQGFSGSTTIALQCAPNQGNVQNNDCPDGCMGLPPFGVPCTYQNSDLQSWLSSIAGGMSSVAHLKNSQVSIQINTPSAAIQSNYDWYGIYGAWIGGQGPQVSCPGTGAGCTFGIGAHSTLSIYKDPLQTTGAYPTSTQQFSGFLSGYNLQQLQAILPNALQNTVYTSIPISDIGLGISYSSSCSVTSMSTCFTSTAGFTATVPIVYDTIGTATTFFGSYQAVNPVVQCYCQTVYGRILDGNSALGPLGQYGPLVGAQASLGNQAGQIGGGLSSFTNSSGYFTLPSIPITSGGSQTFSLYLSNNGYSPQTITVQLQSGGPPLNIGSFTLQPVQGPGNVCIIPPIANPVPGLAPLFPGICLPQWEVVVIIIVAVALIAFTIFLVAPSQRKFSVATGGIGIGI